MNFQQQWWIHTFSVLGFRFDGTYEGVNFYIRVTPTPHGEMIDRTTETDLKNRVIEQLEQI